MNELNPTLYEYLITEFNTSWQPMAPEKIKCNLYNSERDNIQYLGTYFPRSYKEAYVILKNVIATLAKHNYFQKKINVLDLGSGTGGQLFALLQIIEEEVKEPLDIYIFSVDGNQSALNIQKKIYNDMYKHKMVHKIYLYPRPQKFKTSLDIYKFLAASFYNIDILLSFKFLSEMLRYDINIWYATLKAGNKILKPNGIICFNDVSMKIEIKDQSHKEYIPIYMNNNVKKYISEDNNSNTLKYIIPFCCAKNIVKCPREDCYSQFAIDVSFKKGSIPDHYSSLVDYKIFVQYGNLYDIFYDKVINNNCSETCTYDKRKCICSL